MIKTKLLKIFKESTNLDGTYMHFCEALLTFSYVFVCSRGARSIRTEVEESPVIEHDWPEAKIQF